MWKLPESPDWNLELRMPKNRTSEHEKETRFLSAVIPEGSVFSYCRWGSHLSNYWHAGSIFHQWQQSLLTVADIKSTEFEHINPLLKTPNLYISAQIWKKQRLSNTPRRHSSLRSSNSKIPNEIKLKLKRYLLSPPFFFSSVIPLQPP